MSSGSSGILQFVDSRDATPIVTLNPTTPEFQTSSITEAQKSPSAISVTSNSTTDSGFQSVTPALSSNGVTLNRSHNSAFAPLKREMPSSQPDDTASTSSSQSQKINSFKDAQLVSKFLQPTGSNSTNSEPRHPVLSPTNSLDVSNVTDSPRSHGSRDDADDSSLYSSLSRSERRRQRMARRAKHPDVFPEDLQLKDEKQAVLDKEAQASHERKLHRERMRAEKQARKTDPESLEDYRHRRARREVRALARTNRGRVRSLSASRSESFSEEREVKKTPSPLKRSNSFVDMQKIIKEAENRDRHARVETARLEGLIPPRRYLGPKEPIRIYKTQPAHKTINKFKQTEEQSEFHPELFLKRSNSITDFSKVGGSTSVPSAYHYRNHTAPSLYRSQSISDRSTYAAKPNPDIVSYTPRYREYKRRSTERAEDKYEKVQPKTISQPRPAMSMGNLQSPTSPYGAVKREDDSRNLSRQQKRAQDAYQRQRQKAASQTALSTANDFQHDTNWRKREVQNLIMQKSPRSPKDAYYETTQPRSAGANKQPQFSVDNPNYEMLPPPPAPPSDNSQSTTTTPRDDLHNLPPPPEELHNDSSYQNHDSPKPTYNSSNYTSKYDSPKQNYVESAKTTERPSSGKKEEIRKPKALQKSAPASKSSTLPRHFKPQSTEQAIQEQLNALRDEEIEELSAKFDTLTTFEKDRLDNLLNERDFQRRVQEESRRHYSDEDDDDEYIVPDRPDRDRLLQMQAANEADTPQADQEERLRKQEEERSRKEKEEEERREKEERERIIRERLEKERLERKHEEDERKNREKYEREEAIRLEKERRLRERERWEEEKWQKEQDEIKRHQEDEERRRKYEREEYERQQHIRELQREREEQEAALRDIRARREAEARVLRLEREQQRRREKSLRHTSFTNNDEEDSERELLEKKLSEGKPSNFTRFSSSTAPKYAPVSAPAYRKPSQNSYVHSAKRADNPAMRDYPSRSARPVSDGYMLRNNDVFDNEDPAEISPPRSANTVTSTPPSTNSYRGRPISYINTEKTPTVIGAQERYKDPRDRREETLKRDQLSRRRQPDPSQMTFRDRQKLFTAGNTPTEKPRASKKLLELQHSLM